MAAPGPAPQPEDHLAEQDVHDQIPWLKVAIPVHRIILVVDITLSLDYVSHR
jgi:hypothetical protein